MTLNNMINMQINQVMQTTHTCDMNGYLLLADVVARAIPPVQGAAIKQSTRPHGQTGGVATRHAPMSRRTTENKVRTEAVEHTHMQAGAVPDSSEGFVIPQAHRRNNERVAQWRNNQRRGVIIGRGESTGLTAVPPPQRDFFISRVHKLDGMKEVGDFMTNKGVHIKDISKRSNDNAKMNSFKIFISVDDMQKVKDPLFWLKGWIVIRWFERVESIQNDGHVAQSEGTSKFDLNADNIVQSLTLISYNCKHFKDRGPKFDFIADMAAGCGILLIQEHCMYKSELGKICKLASNAFITGKSSMDQSIAAREGRPFGGCAILWKVNLNTVVKEL